MNQGTQTDDNSISTTKGERFSHEDSADLAWMIYRRFGRNIVAAADAWRRLLQNNCSNTQFHQLVQHSNMNDEG